MATLLTTSWQQYGSSTYKYGSATNSLVFKYYIRYQDVAGDPIHKEIQMYASCTCASPSYYRLSSGDNGACKHGVYTTLDGANQREVGYTFKSPGEVIYPLNDSDIPTYTVSWIVTYNSSTGKWSGTIASNHQLTYYSGSDISGCYWYTSGEARYPISNTSATTTVEVYLPDLYPATVTLSASPSDGGTVSGGGSTYVGVSKTVTATPKPAYSFYNWTSNGTVVSSSASYTFTVTGNTNLVANFRPDISSLKWYIIAGSVLKL